MSERVSSCSIPQYSIPRLLQRDDLRFVLIPAGEKGIREKGWNLVSNRRRYNNPVLSTHLQRGGKYGYYPAPGSNLFSFDPEASFTTVSWSDTETIVKAVSPDEDIDTIPVPDKIPQETRQEKTIPERYRLSVLDNLPDELRIAGNMIRGIHPVHGSTSHGGNVAMDPARGLVYCFWCGMGYDTAGWDAVCRGIIPCGGKYDADAMKRHVEVLNREKPEVRFMEKIAWKCAQRKK